MANHRAHRPRAARSWSCLGQNEHRRGGFAGEELRRSLQLAKQPLSYGFRPGRSAHQAVAQAQCYIAESYSYVVDLDLERFFDRVNHDSLMARVAARVADKRVLKLIRHSSMPG
ncbi:MAG: hypothetical protein EOR50_24910 [Mesorhizobium sp.]|nr:MAG: hypothetical protein EOR50_24910 [Mesorhizobium sp.]RWP77128.1 MAG: hypothetical protein EOR09_08990 [Mesorhizobium sp.]